MQIENDYGLSAVARALGITARLAEGHGASTLNVATPSAISFQTPCTGPEHAIELLRFAAAHVPTYLYGIGTEHLTTPPEPTREGRPEVYDAAFVAALALRAAIGIEASREFAQ